MGKPHTSQAEYANSFLLSLGDLPDPPKEADSETSSTGTYGVPREAGKIESADSIEGTSYYEHLSSPELVKLDWRQAVRLTNLEAGAVREMKSRAVQVSEERRAARHFRDHKALHEKYEMKMCFCYDFILEVANEFSDIYFALTSLINEDLQIFYLSMGFLAATLLVRIIVALRQWENVHQNKKVMFAVAVFVSMLEPMAGQRILYTTLDLSNRQSALKRHIIEKKSIAAMRNVGVLMLAFEDVPELILDVIYIFRKGGKIPDMTLFIFTIVLSVLHMVRVIAEFQFESKTLDRLPVILEVGNPDNEADKPNFWIKFDAKGCIDEAPRHKYDLSPGARAIQFAQTVSLVLRDSKTIQVLDLEGCKVGKDVPEKYIGMDGVDMIMSGLPVNVNLQYLNLKGNFLGDGGAELIGNALRFSQSLLYLDLQSNQIADKGATALANGVRENNSLKVLQLTNNFDITYGEGEADLVRACPVDQSGNGVRLFLGHNKAKSKFVYKQEVLEYARKHQKSLKAAAEAISDKRGNFMDEILKYSKRHTGSVSDDVREDVMSALRDAQGELSADNYFLLQPMSNVTFSADDVYGAYDLSPETSALIKKIHADNEERQQKLQDKRRTSISRLDSSLSTTVVDLTFDDDRPYEEIATYDDAEGSAYGVPTTLADVSRLLKLPDVDWIYGDEEPDIAEETYGIYVKGAEETRKKLRSDLENKLQRFEENFPEKKLKRSQFELALEPIGSGQFGEVFYAKQRQNNGLEPFERAVKTLKEGSDVLGLHAAVREAELMLELNHDNVTRLIGVEWTAEPWYIVLEYMRHGDLQGAVKRSLLAKFAWKLQEMLSVCLQASKGCQYISSLKLVHMDIAARNILLGDNNLVKVADFGLMHKMEKDERGERTKYTLKEKLKVATKWTAPEALESSIFREQSDVWSFGVLCWEIFAYGEAPYRRLRNDEVIKKLKEAKQGETLLKKPNVNLTECPDSVWEIIVKCWKLDWRSRPDFETLSEELSMTLKKVPTIEHRDIGACLMEKHNAMPQLNLRSRAGITAQRREAWEAIAAQDKDKVSGRAQLKHRHRLPPAKTNLGLGVVYENAE